MTELPAYLAGLIATILFALAAGWRYRGSRNQLWRVAGVLGLNWFIGFLYVLNTGNPTPWQFNIFIDSAAAAVVMFHPAGRAQVYIGLFYMLQIACHIAFGARQLLQKWLGWELPTDPILYYDTITWIAWAQLFAVGGWGIGIWHRARGHRLRPVRHALDRRASLRSDGEP